MSLSDHAIRAMGFRQMINGEQLDAVFHSAHVYEVRGFTLDVDTVLTLSGAAAGVPYAVAVGNSVTTLADTLFADGHPFNDSAWKPTRPSSPPYVLVRFGPSTQQTRTSGYIKNDVESGMLLTYDCFTTTREELRSLEDQALPPIVSSLTRRFDDGGQHGVRLKHLDRVDFGRTTDGRLVHDFRIHMFGEGYGSSALPYNAATDALASAVALAHHINLKVAGFLHLALAEDDPLKRFLYAFLAIEVHTNTVFKSIAPSRFVSNRPRWLRTRLRSTRSFRLLRGQTDGPPSLRTKFVECAQHEWTHLPYADTVKEFARLLKARHALAHGDNVDISKGLAEDAVRFALGLQPPNS